MSSFFLSLFFFTVTATTEIYTLSLHDALPILVVNFFLFRVLPGDPARTLSRGHFRTPAQLAAFRHEYGLDQPDRKSTRLNSSHVETSYAVFCLKKKTTAPRRRRLQSTSSRRGS